MRLVYTGKKRAKKWKWLRIQMSPKKSILVSNWDEIGMEMGKNPISSHTF